ncbi:hypothetical protein B0J14DRAFT_574349 [Halenospora varia]|nr:hypothetical protein B0J14DRAFT_574349 [Halenospora varia]
MDPLSVTASVIGLLAATGKVVSVLNKVKSSLGSASQLVDQLLSQIKEVEISLFAVDNLLVGIQSAPRRRIAMIQVDQLVATLTETVLTFSELEAMVTPLERRSDIPLLERWKWVWKEEVVTSVMLRLDRHKASLSLMLTIVQCESDLRAERSREILQDTVQQLLESNQEISRRLRNLEGTYDSESVLTTCFRNGKSDKATKKDGEHADFSHNYPFGPEIHEFSSDQ